MTPYDWQQGMANRIQFVEARLRAAAPVIALSLNNGILIATYRRQVGKIFEIYDRLALSAVGQRSDIDAVRTIAIEFCHKEGFQRTEEDVTLQRVLAALSNPVKRAFADFSRAPFIARTLIVEVGDSEDEDAVAILNYDGDYIQHCPDCVLSGTVEQREALDKEIQSLKKGRSQSVDGLLEKLEEILGSQLGEQPEDSSLTWTFQAAMMVRDSLDDRRLVHLKS